MHCRRIVLCLLCSCQSLLAVSTPTECTASSSACAGSDTAALLQGRLDMSREREQQSPTTDTHTSPGEDHKEDEGDKDDEGDEVYEDLDEDNDDNGSTPDEDLDEDNEDLNEALHEDNGDGEDQDSSAKEGAKSSGRKGKGDGREGKGDQKVNFYMPIAEAEELDAAAMKEQPDMLPMVPILFPEMMEAHDKHIASKIQNLTRDRRIRLPDGKEISYWQTLQYANRHFRLHVRKILDSKNPKNKYFNTSMAQKIKLWGVSGILRKMLCHPHFLEWTINKTQAAINSGNVFGKRNQKKTVYERFEAARIKAWVGFNLKSKVLGTAIAGGMSLRRWKNGGEFKGLLKTYMHEMSHLVGYPHGSGVPYDSKYFVYSAIKGNIPIYKVYDLATISNFEVL